MGNAPTMGTMSCGIVRLICEEPLTPPPGQEGKPVVVEVLPQHVLTELARLRRDGWQHISEWHL